PGPAAPSRSSCPPPARPPPSRSSAATRPCASPSPPGPALPSSACSRCAPASRAGSCCASPSPARACAARSAPCGTGRGASPAPPPSSSTSPPILRPDTSPTDPKEPLCRSSPRPPTCRTSPVAARSGPSPSPSGSSTRTSSACPRGRRSLRTSAPRSTPSCTSSPVPARSPPRTGRSRCAPAISPCCPAAPCAASVPARRTWSISRSIAAARRCGSADAEPPALIRQTGGMAENQDPRVAVYLDFDNIVMSWYDRVHGRQAFSRDRQRIAEDPTEPEIAERLAKATVDVGAIIDFAASFGSLMPTRAYADWSSPVNATYRSQLVARAVDLVQLFPAAAYAKNGADIRLAIDTVEDLYLMSDLTHV